MIAKMMAKSGVRALIQITYLEDFRFLNPFYIDFKKGTKVYIIVENIHC